MSTTVLYEAAGPKARLRQRIYTAVSVVALLAIVVWFFWRLNESNQLSYDKWEAFVTPDYLRVILVDGLLRTLQMAFFAIIFAVLFGVFFGIGKLSDHAWVRWPSWLVVELFRAIPVLLLMVFTWYTLGIKAENSAFWAVIIALTLYNGAVLAEVLRAGILAVPNGQREAGYAIGMRKTQVMSIVLLPQAVKIMIPAIISQCVVALKDTALGIYVVAPGLTYVVKQVYLEFHNRVPAILVVGALYVLVNLLLTALASWLQKRYVREKKPLDTPPLGDVQRR
ncbi:MAG: amino acid ABC transporter permease [Nocardioides sp.]|nr:amino acid ABC transporter permease [Nocardioides sp.]